MISLGAALRVYARLGWWRLRRGRLFWAVAGLLALPIVGTLARALAGDWGRGLFDSVMEVYFRFLLPFLPALGVASFLGDEIEGDTLPLWFARPAPRLALPLGRGLALMAPLEAAVALSLPVCYVTALARFPADLATAAPHLLAVEAAATLGVIAYTALALALGAIFHRHPLMAAVAYLLGVEWGLASLPSTAHLLALSWHLRNLADLPHPSSLLAASAVPIWASTLAVVGATGICLSITARQTARVG